ncbi:MAG: tetratricopeptide repeat protein [Myxococcales bacterium]|nr:tetratricopeptide repeat protein [Myxococcales bacterium]
MARGLNALLALLLVLSLSPSAVARAAPSPVQLEARARTAIQAKNYPRAIKLLRQLVKKAKTAARVKLLGDVYSWAKRNAEAIATYRQYVKLAPKDDKAHLKLGLLLSWSKDKKDLLEAIKIFTHHITWQPQNPELRLRRARVRYWAGQRDAAIGDYEAYLKAKPSDAKAKAELANVLTEATDLRQVKRGVALLDDYLKANPNDADTWLRRARAHIRLGDIKSSLEDFAHYVELRPTDEKVRTEMANSLSRVRDGKALAIALSVYNDRITKNPDDKFALLQRCRVLTLLGKTKQAVKDGRAYVALAGRTMKAMLQVAMILSWSRDKASLALALRLLDAYLAQNPGDAKVLLHKARVMSWYGDLGASIRTYQSYLSKQSDDKAMLELSNVLTWDGRRSSLSQAVLYLGRYLKRHPLDHSVRGKRGQLLYRLGRYKEAIMDLKSFMKENPNDGPMCLLLGRALAESGRLQKANEVLEVLLSKKNSVEAELLRAQVQRLRGEHSRAESTLTKLLERTAKRPKLNRQVRIELANLYALTGRRVAAYEMANKLVDEQPKDVAGRQLRKRLESQTEPHVGTNFFAYSDTQENVLFKIGLEGEVYAHPRLSFFVDGSLWRISHVAESLWTQRVDFGIKVRPTTNLEIVGALGPRTYQVYSAELGARIGAVLRPVSWLEAGVQYLYDDLYQIFYQPGSLSARARGHSGVASLRLLLPYRIIGSTQVVLRSVDPENTVVDVSGSVVVPLFSIFSGGYYGRWLAWDQSNPSFWSPSAFNLHNLLVRAQKDIKSVGLSLAAQVAAGIAAERVENIGETGVTFAGSARVDLSYHPVKWIDIRASVDMGFWPRLRTLGLSGGTASPDGQSLRVKTSDSFMWIAPTASVTLRL